MLSVFGCQQRAVVDNSRNVAKLAEAGNYAAAIPLAEAALETAKALHGARHEDVATAADNLAFLYHKLQRLDEAETLFRTALDVRRDLMGGTAEEVAISASNLAGLLEERGRYAEALPLADEAVAIYRSRGVAHRRALAVALNNRANLAGALGHYGEAEAGLEEARQHLFGSKGPEISRLRAAILSNHARVARAQGAFRTASAYLDDAIDEMVEGGGAAHADLGILYNNQADLQSALGETTAAVRNLRLARAIFAEAFGPDNPRTAEASVNLAAVLIRQGDPREGVALLEQALAVQQQSLGPAHPAVTATLSVLTRYFFSAGAHERGLEMARLVRDRRSAVLGERHPDVARSDYEIGLTLEAAGRTAAAADAFRRAGATLDALFPGGHPDLAEVLEAVARQQTRDGHHALAIDTARRALAMTESVFGEDHVRTADGHHALGLALKAGGRGQAALDAMRRAADGYERRVRRAGAAATASLTRLLRRIRDNLTDAVSAVLAERDAGRLPEEAALRDIVRFLQIAKATDTALALPRMAARLAARHGPLAEILRTRAAALARLEDLERTLAQAYAQRTGAETASPGQLRADLADAHRRLAAINDSIATDYPRFADLLSGRPADLAALRRHLDPGEAIVGFLQADGYLLRTVLTADAGSADALPVPATALAQDIQALRLTVDPTGIASPADFRPYPFDIAHDLYRRILGDSALLRDSRVLYVSRDGPLESLPFGMLVDRPVETDAGTAGVDLDRYRGAPWLVRRVAVAALPSLSALTVLRGVAKRSRAGSALIGFGDPSIGRTASGSDRRGAGSAVVFDNRSAGAEGSAEGGAARAIVDSVRALPALPDTAIELRRLADTIGSANSAIYLRDSATEAAVKSLPLDGHRIVAFATHGLVAGELTELTEPALVLTPPERGSARDDGLLTASEVADLSLDAEWVLLSACNTASPSGEPGAEGLSGLARAFLFAGTRSIMATHWPVLSDASVAATTGTIGRIAAKPSLPRAEALRQTQLSMLGDKSRPHYAHPLVWAPYELIGEGGAR